MMLPDLDSVAKHLHQLLGGRKATIDKLNREHDELMDTWNQDAISIGRILRAHLFVEHSLTQFLQAQNPQMNSLEDAGLSFAQKVSLIDPDSTQIKDLLPGIWRLNKVRKRISHSLNADISAADADAWLSCYLSRSMRDVTFAHNSQEPSSDPLDIIEEFALHVGLTLSAASSEFGVAWNRAIQLACEEAAAP